MSNPSRRIVADTSAIINLNGTQSASEILAALPSRLIVVDIAAGELGADPKTGRKDADQFEELKAAGLLEADSLGDIGERIFESLVIGPASSTLDDGEAATIAYAVEHSLGVVVDDTKARRLCQERFRSTPLKCSVELLQDPAIATALGKDRLSLAVMNALQAARMRVLPEHIDWVVRTIGPENSKLCTSLPRRVHKLGK